MTRYWPALLRELGALEILGDEGAFVARCPCHRDSYADLRGDEHSGPTHWQCEGGCTTVEDLHEARRWSARHPLTHNG